MGRLGKATVQALTKMVSTKTGQLHLTLTDLEQRLRSSTAIPCSGTYHNEDYS